MKSVGEKIGRKRAKIENIGTIVTSGHHANGHTYACLAGLVAGKKVSRTEQIIIGEVDGELLCVGNLRSDLNSEVRLVLAWEHRSAISFRICASLGGVILADSKDDGLADLATDRIAKGVFQEGLAEELVGALEKKRFSNSRCL